MDERSEKAKPAVRKAGSPKRRPRQPPRLPRGRDSRGKAKHLQGGQVTNDQQLVDTINWHRIEPGRALIPRGETDGGYDWGCVYASMPVFLEDQVRIYYGASNGLHTDWRDTFLALATLRPDGFAGYAVQDPSRSAVVVTRTLEAAGSEVRLTADIKPEGWVEVTLLDEQGNERTGGRRVTRSVTDGLAAELDPRHSGSFRLRLQSERAQVYSFVLGAAL